MSFVDDETEWENAPTEWNAEGLEPTTDLKEKGFTAGYKPPADYFNNLFNKSYLSIKEIQKKVATRKEIKDELDEALSPEYEEVELEELTSGEKITVAFAKIAKAVKDLIRHLEDKTIHFKKEDITNIVTIELDKAADLDTLMDKNFTSYYCSGSNTVSNNPEAGKAFGLYVYRSATGYITQELLSQTGKKYIRFHNSNEWSDWKMVLYASNIAANLTTTVQGYALDATMGKQLQDTKVDKVSGKGLSANDYTTTEKKKLAGIATGANKTTVDSTLSASSTNPVQNKIVTEQINQLLGLIATQLGSSMKWKNVTSCYMNGELGACYYICMPEADTTSNAGKEVLVVYNNGAIAKGKIVKSGSNYGLENPVTFLTDTTLPLVDKTTIQGGTNTLPYSNNGSIGYCVAPGYGYGAVLEISKSNTYATKYLILN